MRRACFQAPSCRGWHLFCLKANSPFPHQPGLTMSPLSSPEGGPGKPLTHPAQCSSPWLTYSFLHLPLSPRHWTLQTVSAQQRSWGEGPCQSRETALSGAQGTQSTALRSQQHQKHFKSSRETVPPSISCQRGARTSVFLPRLDTTWQSRRTWVHLLSRKHHKSQLPAEQPLTKKDWRLSKR